MRLPAAQTLANYKTSKDQLVIDNLLEEQLAQLKTKIVVLDDDPTGVQTVHDISVFTDWSEESIRTGFLEDTSMFFILTNSRGFTEAETKEAHTEIAKTIEQVSQQLQLPYLIISRGDSTLRGHYPLETEVLRATIEANNSMITFDGEIILPFFKEGGRYTINNIHYVKIEDELVPAGETEFANDRTFGYSASDLTEWIEEKTKGQYKADEAVTISLASLRNVEIETIYHQLMGMKNFNKVIVNAIDYSDVKVFVIALVKAINDGKQFIFRSAAALTKILGGVSDQPLLTRTNLISETEKNGGLIMVGSHVKKTTEQLNELLTLPDLMEIEFNAKTALEVDGLSKEERRISKQVNEYLEKGKTVVVYTSRERLDLGENHKEEELQLSVSISKALTQVVRDLSVRPRFIIAKGGITSSDIGTNGLAVKHALVAGQVKPGIPVWYTGENSKFPNLPYIIFPGNVGDKCTLKDVVDMLG